MSDSLSNISISKSGPSLGLDIGSTTAKLIILSPNGELLFAAYERHLSEPRVVLSRLLAEANELLPGLKVRGACTGSGGIALAKGLGLEESIRAAKDYLKGALKAGLNLGKGSGPLWHSWSNSR